MSSATYKLLHITILHISSSAISEQWLTKTQADQLQLRPVLVGSVYGQYRTVLVNKNAL